MRSFATFAILIITATGIYGYSTSKSYNEASPTNYDTNSDGYHLRTDGTELNSDNDVNTAYQHVDAKHYQNFEYPTSYGDNRPNIPYSSANTHGDSTSSSVTYPNNKGEILIHRPAPIIVKRPPTKVLVNHPPLVVKPAPVVLHKPPAVVMRKVYVKHHPRPVKVEPVYVNVVKPPAEKYFVNEKQNQYQSPQPYAPADKYFGNENHHQYQPYAHQSRYESSASPTVETISVDNSADVNPYQQYYSNNQVLTQTGPMNNADRYDTSSKVLSSSTPYNAQTYQ
uniref:DUF4794 domain-containing protein n=1 Tax=Glossina brevipalpis TaxID=37001 RepID=A0A1A9W924_9MUSC